MKNGSVSVKCCDCRYWNQVREDEPSVGECRRHAPRPMTESPVLLVDPARPDEAHIMDFLPADSGRRFWPFVWAKDWCGEGEARRSLT